MSENTQNKINMAFKARVSRAEIAALFDALNGELALITDRNLDWGKVGSLGLVKTKLVEAVQHLSGLNDTEIQNYLNDAIDGL